MTKPNTVSNDASVDQSSYRVTTAAVTALLLALLAIALMLAVVYFVFAQRIPELTPEALEAAQAKWDQAGPASYTMDIELKGARPGVVHVKVENGETVAMMRDGVTPKQERTWSVWSVPEMFETIERELELAEDPIHEMQATEGTQLWLRCQFDLQYGYPAIFHRAVRGGGPEVYWEITRFEARP